MTVFNCPIQFITNWQLCRRERGCIAFVRNCWKTWLDIQIILYSIENVLKTAVCALNKV